MLFVELRELLRELIASRGQTIRECVGISHFTGEVMHHIDPRIDAERDALVQDLASAGRIGRLFWLEAFAPRSRARNGGGDWYETDRRLAAVTLAGIEAQDLRGRSLQREIPPLPPQR